MTFAVPSVFPAFMSQPVSFWALPAVHMANGGWNEPTGRDSPCVLMQEGMWHRSMCNYKLNVFPLNF